MRRVVVSLVFVLTFAIQLRGSDPASVETETPAEELLQEPTTKSKPAMGMMGTGGMMGMGGGSGGPGYTATWYPTRLVSGQQRDFSFVRQQLQVGVPLWLDQTDKLILNTSIRNSLFDTDAILPDTKRRFPTNLWAISMGIIYMHEFQNGWTAGTMTSFGASSDQPFHSIDEMQVSTLAFLNIPTQNARDLWMFSVMYSPVGNLNFPIPGVAYVWRPSDQFHINIGLPFSVMWKPTDELTFNAFYVPLTNINLRGTYRFRENLSVYAAYEFVNEAYFLVDRQQQRDRFMGFEQHVISGIRWEFWKKMSLDLFGGYAFDRSYGEGRNQGGELRDRLHIAPGPFLGLSLRAGF